jgi:hypothetical protein
LGTTPVTCTATDSSGNGGIATFDVIVVDTTAPVLSLPEDTTVAGDAESGTVVDYVATAADLVDGSVQVHCTPESGSFFTVGNTTVNCATSDSRSNTATGSFTINVELGFLGLFGDYAPPPATFNPGSSIPLVWLYANSSGQAIPSTSVMPMVTITGPGNTVLEFVEDSGNSGLRYDPNTFRWQLNWQTKGLRRGLYTITVRSQATGQENGPFLIELARQ